MSSTEPKSAIAYYPAIVGKVLSALRKSSGMDQAVVAAGLGITQSAYSRIESGATSLTVSQLAAVAKTLKRKPSEILQYADQAADQFRLRGVAVLDHPTGEGADVAMVLGAAAIAAIVLAAISSG